GHANQLRGIPLTPRHRFRVASHSKTFSAAAVMKLREQRRLKLDDRVGTFVDRLHRSVADVTLAQLLSHSAGLVRDGADTTQWALRRPYKDESEVREDLAGGTTIEPNTRFKYSNHGFALIGLAIEAITGERYRDWLAREIIGAAGLHETLPDAPVPKGTPLAASHTAELPLGRRLVVPNDDSLRALVPAGGVVSTAADLVRFFASLSPGAKRSVLSVASRREMIRRQWRDPDAALERWYGLGTLCGSLADWHWFGHSGSLPGHMTRTAVVPAHDLAVSVLTNCNDGLPWPWLDGCLHVLRSYARGGPPSARTAEWTGRWWSPWAAVDLVPMKDKVLVANPQWPNPMLDASEIEVERPARSDRKQAAQLNGTIARATGFASHGEPVRLIRDRRGNASTLWLAGQQLLPEADAIADLQQRFGRDR
ncbi:MAG TPA: serine hydrolase domain-containing protein, partial [Burkholderiaceae bacterium]|nr:serine hydrolase domain-containing protein [Burkholderiaceae bacterium]